MAKLCVNIDHVATVRQARKIEEPSPVAGAVMAEMGGAASITCHLREDRRHIQDADVAGLVATAKTGVNLEMACTDEMLTIAESIPQLRMVMFVPERRQEVTTEGGLDVVGNFEKVKAGVARMTKAGHKVSLFIDAENAQIDAACAAGAQVVELHTGPYANAPEGPKREAELGKITEAAKYAQKKGMQVNAGHGLTLRNVLPIAAIDGICELHIGHSIISRAIMVGIERAVREMVMQIAQGQAFAGNGLSPLEILRRF